MEGQALKFGDESTKMSGVVYPLLTALGLLGIEGAGDGAVVDLPCSS